MYKLLNKTRTTVVLGAFVLSLVSFPLNANAASARELAIKLHNTLAASNPTPTELQDMERALLNNDRMLAAQIATVHDNFLNITVRQYFAPMGNLSSNPVSRLNVIIATGMGLVRDNRPYTEILTSNNHYQVADPTSGGVDLQNYNVSNSTHYEDAEAKGINIARELVAIPNQGRAGYTDAAGLMTTDLEIINSFFMGTNRRGWERAVDNYLGKTIDEVRVAGLQNERIRRDVSRDNGGNVNLFPKECATCHSHMDPLVSAFNCYDTNGQTPIFPVGPCLPLNANGSQQTNGIRSKVNQTPPGFYAAGYVEGSVGRTDDFELRNPLVGWKRASGKGAKQLGLAMSETDLFAENAVARVWTLVCTNAELSDASKVSYGKYFRGPLAYNLKSLFQYVASLPQCLGSIGE